MACISNKGCLITLNSVCKIYQLYSSYCFYGEIVGNRAELAKFESKSYHEIMPTLSSNQVCNWCTFINQEKCYLGGRNEIKWNTADTFAFWVSFFLDRYEIMGSYILLGW